MKHKIEEVELFKGSYNTGDTLSYTADGKPRNVTGQFFIDPLHQLHHTHIFPDGEEMEIVVPYA